MPVSLPATRRQRPASWCPGTLISLACMQGPEGAHGPSTLGSKAAEASGSKGCNEDHPAVAETGRRQNHAGYNRMSGQRDHEPVANSACKQVVRQEQAAAAGADFRGREQTRRKVQCCHLCVLLQCEIHQFHPICLFVWAQMHTDMHTTGWRRNSCTSVSEQENDVFKCRLD